jgi:hypothetical protein
MLGTRTPRGTESGPVEIQQPKNKEKRLALFFNLNPKFRFRVWTKKITLSPHVQNPPQSKMLGTRTPRGHDRSGPVKSNNQKNKGKRLAPCFFNLNPKV